MAEADIPSMGATVGTRIKGSLYLTADLTQKEYRDIMATKVGRMQNY